MRGVALDSIRDSHLTVVSPTCSRAARYQVTVPRNSGHPRKPLSTPPCGDHSSRYSERARLFGDRIRGISMKSLWLASLSFCISLSTFVPGCGDDNAIPSSAGRGTSDADGDGAPDD